MVLATELNLEWIVSSLSTPKCPFRGSVDPREPSFGDMVILFVLSRWLSESNVLAGRLWLNLKAGPLTGILLVISMVSLTEER